jgi:hypothetical protein
MRSADNSLLLERDAFRQTRLFRAVLLNRASQGHSHDQHAISLIKRNPRCVYYRGDSTAEPIDPLIALNDSDVIADTHTNGHWHACPMFYFELSLAVEVTIQPLDQATVRFFAQLMIKETFPFALRAAYRLLEEIGDPPESDRGTTDAASAQPDCGTIEQLLAGSVIAAVFMVLIPSRSPPSCAKSQRQAWRSEYGISGLLSHRLICQRQMRMHDSPSRFGGAGLRFPYRSGDLSKGPMLREVAARCYLRMRLFHWQRCCC